VGLFDFMKKKKSAPPAAGEKPAEKPLDKKVAGPAKIARDKKAQTYDRMEAIQQLAEMKTPEAAAALLKRFTFVIDPTITDQEEKEVAFQGVIAAGDECVQAVIEFCEAAIKKSEQLTWPLKILRELLDDGDYHDELIELLGRFETEYTRNVEPKIQVIQALEEVVSEEVREAVAPFLEDANETVRFHAVQTTFAQNEPKSLPALVKLLEAEESVRVKNKVAEGLMFRGWVIPPDLRDAIAVALRDTSGYHVGADGKIARRAGDWH
jgi:HEAT repeat protein